MKLERAKPQDMGVSPEAILNFLDAAKDNEHELHSFMLLKGGKVIYERWWPPFAPNYRHQLFSLSKSFASTAIGFAVDEGIVSTDTLLKDIFKAEFEQIGNKMDDEVLGMTVKNLLTMSTGMEYEAWPDEHENCITSFLTAHTKDKPGETFRYSSIATYMLSAVITRLTGLSLVQFLKPRLFEPLGMTEYYWSYDAKTGVHMGGFGLNTVTENIAKFGQLYLQKGMWNGQRILSEAWVNEATSSQISNGNNGDGDWGCGYGYQFWQCTPQGAYRGDGMFGQFCIVAPNEDIVIAITSNVDMPALCKSLWVMLEDIKKLSPDEAANLDSYEPLNYLAVDENAENYPVFMAEYEMDGGHFSSVNVDFSGQDCVISLYDTKKDKYMPIISLFFEKGKWCKGAAPHFTKFIPLESDKLCRTISYGAWEKNVFTATIWFYESACKDQMRFTFSKDLKTVMVEARGGTYNSEYTSVGTGKIIVV